MIGPVWRNFTSLDKFSELIVLKYPQIVWILMLMDNYPGWSCTAPHKNVIFIDCDWKSFNWERIFGIDDVNLIVLTIDFKNASIKITVKIDSAKHKDIILKRDYFMTNSRIERSLSLKLVRAQVWNIILHSKN